MLYSSFLRANLAGTSGLLENNQPLGASASSDNDQSSDQDVMKTKRIQMRPVST